LELDPPAVTTGPPIAAGAASNLRTGPQLLCAAPAPPPADPEAPAPPAPPPVIVCSAGLSLLVPASTAAGTYLATLTLTLV
jgi:hypothetical protein